MSKSMMHVTVSTGLLGLMTAIGLPSQLGAQDTPVSCGEGQHVIGTLGIPRLGCGACVVTFEGGRRMLRFDTEPVVNAVGSGGPADGKLEVGDRVVAIDDALITSAEGGRRWSTIAPGENVTLLVRRDGQERRVHVEAAGKCAPLYPEDKQDYVIVRRDPGDEQRVTIVASRSRRWFGVTLRCANRPGEVGVCLTPPEVIAVEDPGPASEAGLRVGDVLTEIDGLSLTSPEGERRWSQVRPGESVRLLVVRNLNTLTVQVTPVDRASVTGEPALSRDELLRRLESLRSLRDTAEIRAELDRLLRQLREGGAFLMRL